MQSEGHLFKVLLIDDDPDDFMVFQDAVNQVDDAVELIYLNSTRQHSFESNDTGVHLIFLDINMPNKDGFHWLSEIRNLRPDIPVIMYSTASNFSFVKKAYDEGATLYFPKPESFKKLKQSLEVILRYNWNSPSEVKAEFCKQGNYVVFSLP